MGKGKITNKIPYKQKIPHNLKYNRDLDEYVDKLLRISTIPQQSTAAKSLECHKEIHEVIEKIRKLELKKNTGSKHIVDRRSGAVINNFTKWARENGAEIKGCSIAEFPGFELGLKVLVDIPQSSLVIAVPRKLLMSLEAARAGPLAQLLNTDWMLKSMPNVALAMFLLFEKCRGDSSFWKPYIDILPKKYSTILYFDVADLEELQSSPTLEIALRQIKNIARQYAYFHKLFYTSDDEVSQWMRNKFTYNEYCWAVSTVMTRQNTIPFENDFHALIPLWDLCNHSNGTISTAYNPILDRSECLALRDFKSGEQLFIFYGARTNSDLFIHNGFVYEDNEHDGYWIRFGISKSDPLQGKRNDLLKKLSIASSGEFFIKKSSNPIDGQLLAFLRVFNMSEDQLEYWLESEKCSDLTYAECALDTALEKKSWKFLEARLKLLLAAYKTTLEDDEKLLSDKELLPNLLLAIRMRATEKRIIRDTLEYVEQRFKQ